MSEQKEGIKEQLTSLTKREKEILQLLAEGLTYKEIAAHLFISGETVRKHMKTLYKKMGVHNKTQAIKKMAFLE